MKTRTLGRNGPEVSAIGFGAMVLSPGIYSPVNDEASIETIHRLLDLGINFIDTADIYGNGHNERLVGRAIRDRRDRVVLATKFGANVHEDGSHVRGLGRRDAVRKAIDASLQRLGLDFVDLYYHIPLGRGLLTGHIRRPEDLKPDDWRRSVPRFQGDNLRRNLQVVDALEAIAKRKGLTLSQLALAWLLHKGDDVVPIPGSRHAKNMEQNARAADVALDAKDLEEINRAARGVAGERGDELYLETIRSGQQQHEQPNA
jgi:aryl-alcohol dehydrogenase-like predicted oxidoreductase